MLVGELRTTSHADRARRAQAIAEALGGQHQLVDGLCERRLGRWKTSAMLEHRR